LKPEPELASVRSETARPFAGVDLGGTNIQIGIVSPENEVSGRVKLKTRASEGVDAVLDRLEEGVRTACEEVGVGVDDLGGVGVGAPGAVDPLRGVVGIAVNLGWRDVPLAKLLGDRLGVPVSIENDVNAAVYAEWRMGAGRGADHLLGVWLGTGVGGGLVLNGQLHEGHFLSAGEIGHIVLRPESERRRTVEDLCSRTAVVKRIAKAIEDGRESIVDELTKGNPGKAKSKVIGKAWEAGDELVLEIAEETAGYLGLAIANIVTLLSIERVVLGGGLGEVLGQTFADMVAERAREYVFPEAAKAMQVVPSDLEDNAGLLGAAECAREAQVEDERDEPCRAGPAESRQRGFGRGWRGCSALPRVREAARGLGRVDAYRAGVFRAGTFRAGAG
jgi:glucokinase